MPARRTSACSRSTRQSPRAWKRATWTSLPLSPRPLAQAWRWRRWAVSWSDGDDEVEPAGGARSLRGGGAVDRRRIGLRHLLCRGPSCRGSAGPGGGGGAAAQESFGQFFLLGQIGRVSISRQRREPLNCPKFLNSSAPNGRRTKPVQALARVVAPFVL